MTCHFINEESFERKSFVLGCKRIKGSHNYSNIAEVMTDIIQLYNIDQSKITHIVTDNASNFGKSFRTFSTGLVLSQPTTTTSIGDLNENSSDSEDSDLEREIVYTIDVDQLFNSSEQHNSFCLPHHMKCCAHTLNLIATTDISKITTTSYINISELTFKKLFSFWTLVSRSTVASDKIYEICGCKFPIPVVTRWNSLYDACKKILKYKQQLLKAFDELNLQKLKLNEWIFLEEYCKVMEPLAISLDKLQGEKKSFLGYVAPTILVLRRLLISYTELKHCKPLNLAIIKALETRFYYLFDLHCTESKDYIISSISHPKFKLNWVPKRYLGFCKNLFLTECNIVSNSVITVVDSINLTTNDNDSDNSDNEFYNTICNENDDVNDIESSNSNNAYIQGTTYLNSKNKELILLNEYPIIKQLFLKHNTTIPSSAPVERLFSKAIQVLTPRRNKLNDKTFEMILCCRSIL